MKNKEKSLLKKINKESKHIFKKNKKIIFNLILLIIILVAIIAVFYHFFKNEIQMLAEEAYLEFEEDFLDEDVEDEYFGDYTIEDDMIENEEETIVADSNTTVSNLEEIPEYSGEIYVYINDNIPYFEDTEITTEVFEIYSELDDLGRCGVAYANICLELMPTEERDSISSVTPSGWVQAKYNGEYLYNRCHLIGYQLAGENANELNLITGTSQFNVDGMLPFENLVADYIDVNTSNHVLYRVTPYFEGDNLVATGVEMEAYSVEDGGEGVCYNVFVYNVQDGITIDYSTGDSSCIVY